MSPTPATLPRHELTGLPVRVADASDPGLIGIEGTVVRETTATLCIRSGDESPAGEHEEPRVRRVPKEVATFEFALTDETADGESPPEMGARKGSGTTFEPRDAGNGVANGRPGTACEASGESVAYVTVDGARLHARPAQRSETTGDSKWR